MGERETLFDAARDGREGMVTVVDYEGRIVGSMGQETWQALCSGEVFDALVRLDDRAQRMKQCLSAQLEQDYPLTYERAYWLACDVTDYLPTLRKAVPS